MYQSGAFAERYALARRTLIQAAITLRERWPKGFILVGAHAVYLHTPRERSAISTFTFDGDLAVDPTSSYPRASSTYGKLMATTRVLRCPSPGLKSARTITLQ